MLAAFLDGGIRPLSPTWLPAALFIVAACQMACYLQVCSQMLSYSGNPIFRPALCKRKWEDEHVCKERVHGRLRENTFQYALGGFDANGFGAFSKLPYRVASYIRPKVRCRVDRIDEPGEVDISSMLNSSCSGFPSYPKAIMAEDICRSALVVAAGRRRSQSVARRPLLTRVPRAGLCCRARWLFSRCRRPLGIAAPYHVG